MSDEENYKQIVAKFRELTSRTSPDSARCCLKTYRGVPHCSHTVADGTYSLTFTQKEIAVLKIPNLMNEGLKLAIDNGIYTGKSESYVKVGESLHTGLIADTLECASHPTRPIVRDGKVIAVATVTDCIAEYDMEYLKSIASDLFYLWYRAVEIFGIKPYYLTGAYDPKKYLVL